jgi:hypothetical protein
LSADEEKKSLVDKLKKEIAKLDFEEKLLRKRDDRLKWEQEMLSMEEGLKVKGNAVFDGSPPAADVVEESKVLAEPVSEPAPAEEPPLESGTTYLLFEPTPERSVKLFLRELKEGMKGLYITRSNPNQVRKKYALGDAKICWLTGVRATNEILSISGLQELSITVSNAIDENPKTVVLLDGVEYLVSNNDFSIVLRLIQQIRDKVSTSESKLIIPMNPNALDARQLTLLERECRTIR